MNCRDAIAELMKALEEERLADREARAHVRGCERCTELFTSFGEETALAPTVDDAAAVAERAVMKQRARTTAIHWMGVIFLIGVFSLPLLLPLSGVSGLSRGEAVMIAGAGLAIAVIVGLPVLLLVQVISRMNRSVTGRHFYKRLRPGRWLSGICLGISEATGIRVELVRLMFAVAAWFKGFGILAYIICDLVMPVHPADREYLLRFRLQRWLRSFREAGLPKE